MDTEAILQGLELSLMSIITTFLALGMFIGIILLLRAAFPAQPRHRKTAEDTARAAVVSEEEEIIINVAGNAQEGDDALTAAIAAALYVKNTYQPANLTNTTAVIRRSPGGLGARLEQPRSRWWQSTDNQ